MKVLLLKPPARGFYFEEGRHFPIGLAYLAGVLQHAGHEVTIFDSLAFREDTYVLPDNELVDIEREKLARHPRWKHLLHFGANWQRIQEELARVKPDVIGISCMFSPYYVAAYKAASVCKELCPAAPLLFGGPHATVAYSHVLDHSVADVVFLGEAENRIVSVLTALEQGRSLLGFEGLAFRCGAGFCDCSSPKSGGTHAVPKTEWLQNLDSLPYPVVNGFDFARYDYGTTIITSRGCPFACTFCTVHATVGRTFRARAPVAVVDEIEWYIKTCGVKKFAIEDDNFTFDISRVFEICREIVRRGLKITLSLPNGITVVKMSEELAAAMVDAGFRYLFIGLESTDGERLKDIAKGFTSVEAVNRSIGWFKKHGLESYASLICGLPHQSVEECARDVARLWYSGVRFMVNPFYPIPGSPDYQRCLELGIITKESDYALFEGNNFYGSDQMPSRDLYWTWVASYALSNFGEFIRSGREAGLASRAGGVDEALRALARTLGNPHQLEGGATSWRYAVPRFICTCSRQRLTSNAGGGCRALLCVLAGDMLAAIASLYTGIAVEAEEKLCRASGNAPQCVFELVTGSAPNPVLETFTAALDGVICARGDEESLNRSVAMRTRQ